MKLDHYLKKVNMIGVGVSEYGSKFKSDTERLVLTG